MPTVKTTNICSNDGYFYTKYDHPEDCYTVELSLPYSKRGFANWVLEMIDQYDITPIELAAIIHSIQLEKGHSNDQIASNATD